jgi:hypothetical protein
MAKINVNDAEITIISVEEKDYISLTDMANAKESESRAADIIKNWLRSRYTLEFLRTWEQINNPTNNLDNYNMDTKKQRFGVMAGAMLRMTILCQIQVQFFD